MRLAAVFILTKNSQKYDEGVYLFSPKISLQTTTTTESLKVLKFLSGYELVNIPQSHIRRALSHG